jgi:hypothetical protein
MALRIPDNAREAFQFLALGIAVVLVVRLCMLLLANLGPDEHTALATACRPLQASYPLVGAHVLVTDPSELVPRLSSAALFVVMCGAVLGIFSWTVTILSGRLNKNLVPAAVRAGLLVGSGWALWCLLAGPARCTLVHDDGLELRNATRFMGGIALPFTQERTWVPFSEVARFEHRPGSASNGPCAESHQLIALLHGGGEHLLLELEGRCEPAASTAEEGLRVDSVMWALGRLLDQKEPS